MDHRQFAEHFEAAYPRLWLIAAAVTVDTSEVDDILQEAAITAFKKRDTFRSGTNFVSWVAQIVRYTASNHSRKTSNRTTRIQPSDPSQLDTIGAPTSNPSTAGIAHDRRSLTDRSQLEASFQRQLNPTLDDILVKVLEQLTEEARLCLLLRIVDELSYREISQIISIPENTAMSHVHRAKQKLRQSLLAENSEGMPHE